VITFNLEVSPTLIPGWGGIMSKTVSFIILSGVALAAIVAVTINTASAREEIRFVQFSVLAEDQADYGVDEGLSIPAISAAIIEDRVHDLESTSSIPVIKYTSLPVEDQDSNDTQIEDKSKLEKEEKKELREAEKEEKEEQRAEDKADREEEKAEREELKEETPVATPVAQPDKPDKRDKPDKPDKKK
jgi:hypothetical protein